MTIAEFTAPASIPRDRWGRPLLVPPGGGARVPYRRVTTFVGALEDQTALTRWKLRQQAKGLATRPDLVLATAAADPDDKARLDEIAEAALEHAMSSAAATTGTSLHALTERLDRGQTLGPVPEPYGADLKAYEKATAGIEFTDIEAFRVLDDWRVAGTADRIGRVNDSLMIIDIKTGWIDYPAKMSMQLAMYARSLPYDIVTDTRGPATLGLNLRYGIIIHLPAGEGRCTLHRVDIARGWGGCTIAKTVFDWRASKGLLGPLDETTGIKPSFIDEALTPPTVEDLRALWRRADRGCAATPEFLEACQARKKQLAN